jgi:hypothetical protein
MKNFIGHIWWLNLFNDSIQLLHLMAKRFYWLILIIKLTGKIYLMINSSDTT